MRGSVATVGELKAKVNSTSGQVVTHFGSRPTRQDLMLYGIMESCQSVLARS